MFHPPKTKQLFPRITLPTGELGKKKVKEVGETLPITLNSKSSKEEVSDAIPVPTPVAAIESKVEEKVEVK